MPDGQPGTSDPIARPARTISNRLRYNGAEERFRSVTIAARYLLTLSLLTSSSCPLSPVATTDHFLFLFGVGNFFADFLPPMDQYRKSNPLVFLPLRMVGIPEMVPTRVDRQGPPRTLPLSLRSCALPFWKEGKERSLKLEVGSLNVVRQLPLSVVSILTSDSSHPTKHSPPI